MFWKNNKARYYINQWSLTNKLTFLYTSVSLSILIFLAIIAYWIVYQVIITAEKQYIIDEVHILQNLLEKHPNQLSSLTQEVNAVPEALTNAEYRYYIKIYDNKNNVLMETPGIEKALIDARYPILDEKNWQNHWLHWKSITGKKFLSMRAPIQFDKNGKSNLYMEMSLDGTYPEEIINNYGSKALLFLFIITGIIIILARAVTKRGLRRLYDMVQITESISIEKLTARTELYNWPRELVPLWKAFNQMLIRIEKAFQRISDSTTELAHEIRTPIHNLILSTEVVLNRVRSQEEYKNILESNFEEYKRLSNIIDSILFLARTENANYSLQKSNLILDDELKKLAEYYKIIASEKNIHITLHGKGVIQGNLILLQRAISNLLNNAIQHTPQGGLINIIIQKNANSYTEILIKDNGSGIPTEHHEYIFERFYRVKKTEFCQSSGIGLGLAIVKAIVELHDGIVSVKSEINSGTTFILGFP